MMIWKGYFCSSFEIFPFLVIQPFNFSGVSCLQLGSIEVKIPTEEVWWFLPTHVFPTTCRVATRFQGFLNVYFGSYSPTTLHVMKTTN